MRATRKVRLTCRQVGRAASWPDDSFPSNVAMAFSRGASYPSNPPPAAVMLRGTRAPNACCSPCIAPHQMPVISRASTRVQSLQPGWRQSSWPHLHQGHNHFKLYEHIVDVEPIAYGSACKPVNRCRIMSNPVWATAYWCLSFISSEAECKSLAMSCLHEYVVCFVNVCSLASAHPAMICCVRNFAPCSNATDWPGEAMS